MTDKEQTIAGWEFVLERGRPTLSPGMLELIHTTLGILRNEPYIEAKRQKAINTWTNMVTSGGLPSSMQKQVGTTILLLRRQKQADEL